MFNLLVVPEYNEWELEHLEFQDGFTWPAEWPTEPVEF